MFLNDKEIVEGLKQTGTFRRRAEDQLFSQYAYLMNTSQKKFKLNDDEIFTAYSDTVLKIIEKIISDDFEGRSSIKTYLFTIFNNKCVDVLRKKSSNKYAVNNTEEFTDTLADLSDPAKSIIQVLIERTDIESLKKKLQDLGNKCRELLEYFINNSPDKTTAEKLGYSSADVVRTSRGRCIEKLRQ